MTTTGDRYTCKRCGAPLSSSRDDEDYHPKCRLVEKVDDKSCSNCGNYDVAFNLMDGNLIQYCDECEGVEVNPHE